MNKYSLADKILSIKPNDAQINANFGTITVGGEGSYLDSFSVNPSENMFSTQGFSTGAWVHNKNVSRIGTCELSLNQISEQVKKLIMLCETYYSGEYDGFTLTLSTNDGKRICTCIDCYIQKIPSQNYQPTAQTQTWSFTCGKITFN